MGLFIAAIIQVSPTLALAGLGEFLDFFGMFMLGLAAVAWLLAIVAVVFSRFRSLVRPAMGVAGVTFGVILLSFLAILHVSYTIGEGFVGFLALFLLMNVIPFLLGWHAVSRARRLLKQTPADRSQPQHSNGGRC